MNVQSIIILHVEFSKNDAAFQFSDEDYSISRNVSFLKVESLKRQSLSFVFMDKPVSQRIAIPWTIAHLI